MTSGHCRPLACTQEGAPALLQHAAPRRPQARPLCLRLKGQSFPPRLQTHPRRVPTCKKQRLLLCRQGFPRREDTRALRDCRRRQSSTEHPRGKLAWALVMLSSNTVHPMQCRLKPWATTMSLCKQVRKDSECACVRLRHVYVTGRVGKKE